MSRELRELLGDISRHQEREIYQQYRAMLKDPRLPVGFHGDVEEFEHFQTRLERYMQSADPEHRAHALAALRLQLMRV